MKQISEQQNVNPVDQILPVKQSAILGLQHVLVMYVGAVAVPLIIGRVLKLNPQQVSLLISADLFCCGLVTIIQSLGIGGMVGIRLPVMMGVTFAAVGPMIAIGLANPGTDGLREIFGAGIVSGIFGIVIAPFVSRMIRFFPPLVTGAVITIIGLSLLKVGIGWVFGIPVGPTAPQLVNPEHTQWLGQINTLAASANGTIPAAPAGLKLAATLPNPKYAALSYVAFSALVLLIILFVARFAKGFLSNIAVLIGVTTGAIIATLLGFMHYDNVIKADFFALVLPLQYGVPIFKISSIFLMCVVMIIIMVESTGMFLALGQLTGKPVGQKELANGLRTDGIGTFLGGLFNTFPYTSFSQNVGLVGITGVRSRYVCVAGGVILILMGLIPKLAALVEAIPNFVLGGAGLVMFGMVTATGIRILAKVDYENNHNNLIVVAISLSLGMIPQIAPDFKQWMAHGLHPLIESGIVLTTVTAITLNIFFNGTKSHEEAMLESAAASQMAE